MPESPLLCSPPWCWNAINHLHKPLLWDRPEKTADMYKVPVCRSPSLSLDACDFHQECFIWILYYMCCPKVLKGGFNMWILCSVACETTMRHTEKCWHLWAQMHFTGPLVVKWSIQDGTGVCDASYCYSGEKRILYILLVSLWCDFWLCDSSTWGVVSTGKYPKKMWGNFWLISKTENTVFIYDR